MIRALKHLIARRASDQSGQAVFQAYWNAKLAADVEQRKLTVGIPYAARRASARKSRTS